MGCGCSKIGKKPPIVRSEVKNMKIQFKRTGKSTKKFGHVFNQGETYNMDLSNDVIDAIIESPQFEVLGGEGIEIVENDPVEEAIEDVPTEEIKEEVKEEEAPVKDEEEETKEEENSIPDIDLTNENDNN